MAVFKDKKTGKWTNKFRCVDWTGRDIQIKRTGFKTQKEAKAFESRYRELKEGTADITFEALYENYLEDCKSWMKPTSIKNKTTTLKTVILPYFGKLKICNISPLCVRNWQRSLMSSPKHYAQTSLRTFQKQLSAIMNYAVRFYGLKENPCHKTGTMGEANSDRCEIWTLEDFNKFIATKKHNPVSEAIFTLLFFSGIREGELFALCLNDFDFTSPQNSVTISKNYERINGQDYITTPKTKKGIRKIYLPDCVRISIKKYIFRLHGYLPTDRLFPYTKHFLYNEIERGCKESGVKVIHVHDIRHSNASLLMNMDTPIKQISKRLGHQNIQTTLNIYAHLYEEKEVELVDKLNDISRKQA